MSELHAATERVRRIEEGGVQFLDVYPKCREKPPNQLGEWNERLAESMGRECYRDDLELLAFAYIHTHRADDDEPERTEPSEVAKAIAEYLVREMISDGTFPNSGPRRWNPDTAVDYLVAKFRPHLDTLTAQYDEQLATLKTAHAEEVQELNEKCDQAAEAISGMQAELIQAEQRADELQRQVIPQASPQRVAVLEQRIAELEALIPTEQEQFLRDMPPCDRALLLERNNLQQKLAAAETAWVEADELADDAEVLVNLLRDDESDAQATSNKIDHVAQGVEACREKRAAWEALQ